MPIYGDVTYDPVWKATPRAYSVTWVMTDVSGGVRTVVETYRYEDVPSYGGSIFAPADRRFIGWDREVVAVAGDATYTACYAGILVLGDLTGDGLVNTRDLALLRLYLVGKTSLSANQLLAADVYRDSAAGDTVCVNTRDAALLQQYIVGYISTFD